MQTDDIRTRLDSMLRRVGLSGVSRPVLVCMAAVCAGLVLVAAWHFWPGGGEAGGFELQADAVAEDAASREEASGTGAAAVIKVDVEGCVVHPGVYELAADARAADALEAAGGANALAAPAGVNLAQKLEDGMQLYVPSKKEAAGSKPATSADATSATGGSEGKASSAASDKVNINTASAEQLQSLSGIGPVLAQAIVDYRTQNGSFGSVEDLKKVSGIGDARYAQLKDRVCV